MRVFCHDFETYSEVDLKKAGVSRYARHESTEVLMLGYVFDDGPVRQWFPHLGEPLPDEVSKAVQDPNCLKVAWNKTFEWNIWKHVLGFEIPHTQWRDAQVMALFLSLPGRLSKCGEVMRLPQYLTKLDGGTRLINLFSKLAPETKKKPSRRIYPKDEPESWEQFCEYNVRDVVSERKIYQLLRKYDLPQKEWEMWFLDQEINERGIPVNLRMGRNVVRVRDQILFGMLAEMKEITGLGNPNSQPQLLGWLRSRQYKFQDISAGHIKSSLKDAVQKDADQDYIRVLKLRKFTSRSSLKKFDSILANVDGDGRLRNTFQFSGAGRTTRWAGRVFQPQNLVRPVSGFDGIEWGKTGEGHSIVLGGDQIENAAILEKLDLEGLRLVTESSEGLVEMMVGSVRPIVQAPPGYVFLDADFKAIENVVLGWQADDRKILDPFVKGRDPYLDFGRYLYRTPYEVLEAEYKSGDKGKRQICKPAVLGCGYGLGAGECWYNGETGEWEATGLIAYAMNMGIDLNGKQSQEMVTTWRETFSRAVDYWAELTKAAKKTLRTGRKHDAGAISFEIKKPFLRMNLPGGSYLHYLRPRIENVMAPWGDPVSSITYEGLNPAHQWIRLSTHPGKLVENSTQKIARDLLRDAMLRAASRGVSIVMHVHDQIVGIVREKNADRGLSVLLEAMSDFPWASGLPATANGHITTHFVKD